MRSILPWENIKPVWEGMWYPWDKFVVKVDSRLMAANPPEIQKARFTIWSTSGGYPWD